MFVLTGGNVLYISEMQTHLSVLMGRDKTWGRPWPRPWGRPWGRPWPTGG